MTGKKEELLTKLIKRTATTDELMEVLGMQFNEIQKTIVALVHGYYDDNDNLFPGDESLYPEAASLFLASQFVGEWLNNPQEEEISNSLKYWGKKRRELEAK